MMKLCVGERQTGKTTSLIYRSANTGEVIVCGTLFNVKYVKNLADKLGVSIPDPITSREFLHRISYSSSTKYLIDDLELMLSAFGVQYATISSGAIERVSD